MLKLFATFSFSLLFMNFELAMWPCLGSPECVTLCYLELGLKKPAVSTMYLEKSPFINQAAYKRSNYTSISSLYGSPSSLHGQKRPLSGSTEADVWHMRIAFLDFPFKAKQQLNGAKTWRLKEQSSTAESLLKLHPTQSWVNKLIVLLSH